MIQPDIKISLKGNLFFDHYVYSGNFTLLISERKLKKALSMKLLIIFGFFLEISLN